MTRQRKIGDRRDRFTIESKFSTKNSFKRKDSSRFRLTSNLFLFSFAAESISVERFCFSRIWIFTTIEFDLHFSRKFLNELAAFFVVRFWWRQLFYRQFDFVFRRIFGMKNTAVRVNTWQLIFFEIFVLNWKEKEIEREKQNSTENVRLLSLEESMNLERENKSDFELLEWISIKENDSWAIEWRQ